MQRTGRTAAIAWLAGGTIIAMMSTTRLAAQSGDKPANDKDRRPSPSVRASPAISFSPARVHATAELKGGANDYEEYYCPAVVWAWGDGTESENSTDCAPYEAGKSEIKRRFTVQHVFPRAGMYRVTFRLKRHSKAVGFATVNVQIRPGLREGGQ